MSEKKLTKYAAIFCAFCFVLFLASFVRFLSSSASPKPVLSALLNPKNAKKIDEIAIFSNDSDEMTLFKTDAGWFAKITENEKETVCTRADEKIVEIFIEKSAKVRPLYKISENERDRASFGLGENEAFIAQFNSLGETKSRIFFGAFDELLSRRAIRADSPISFECEDDFSQFLTTSLDFWAKGEIFAPISEDDAQTITFVCPEKAADLKIIRDDEKFAEIAHFLLSLRHGSVKNAQFFGKSKKVAEITFFSGKDFEITLQILENESGKRFLKKTKSPGNCENSVFEISDWTLEKIFSIFENFSEN